MIHIHRCTFLAQGNSAWENGSTISVNRVKEILANQLKGLEDLPGKIHLKKLTLDLGDFESLEFNKEFISRLEHSCQDLEKKLRELHRSQINQQNPEEKEYFDELIAFLYSFDLTPEIENIIYLLESRGVAPKLEDWQEFQFRYEQLFGNELSSKLKESFRSKLISSERHEREIESPNSLNLSKRQENEEDFNQEHVSFLIDSLDRIPMNTNWFKTLDDWFNKEFGTKMSLRLYNRIRKVYDSFEFGIQQSSEHTKVSLPIHDRLDKSLLTFFQELENSQENQEMKALLVKMKTSNSDVFFSELFATYEQEYGKSMPFELERQVLWFQRANNPLKWLEVDRTKRQRLLNKLSLLKELRIASRDSKRKSGTVGFSEEEYGFLCGQLTQIPIDAAWYSRIVSNFERKFHRTMLGNLQEILLKFSQDVQRTERAISNVSNLEGETWTNLRFTIKKMAPQSKLLAFFQSIGERSMSSHEDFISAYQEYFGHTMDSEDRGILIQAERRIRHQIFQDTLSRRKDEFYGLLGDNGLKIKSKGKRNARLKSEMRFNPNLFEDIQFDLGLMSKIDARFQEIYQRSLPKRILKKVLRFLRDVKKNITPEAPVITWTEENGRVSIVKFREFLKGLKHVQDVEELLDILPSSNGTQQQQDIDELMLGFAAFYGREAHLRLKGLVRNYYEESLPDGALNSSKIQVNKAKKRIEKHVLINQKSVLVEPKFTIIIKQFLLAKTSFDWTNGVALSEFQEYFRKETGQIFPNSEKSNFIRLWKEVQARIHRENSLSIENMRAKFSSIYRQQSEQSKNRKKKVSGILHPDFVKPAIEFILNFLDQPFSKNWLKKLKEEFRSEFKSTIPDEWLHLLERYDVGEIHVISSGEEQHESDGDLEPQELKELSPASLKSRLIVYLTQSTEIPGSEKLLMFLSKLDVIDSLDALFEQFEIHRNEALPLGLKVMLQRWWKRSMKEWKVESHQAKSTNEARTIQLRSLVDECIKDMERGEQELRDFLNLMLDTVPLDACWLAIVVNDYKRQYGRDLPANLFNRLLLFTGELSEELTEMNEPSMNAERNSRIITQIFDEVVLGLDRSPILDDLKAILDEMSLGKSPFSLVQLSERFKQKFDRDIPHDLLEKVMLAHSRVAKFKWGMLPKDRRRELIESIKTALSSEKNDSILIGKDIDDFNEQLTFLIHTLEHTSLDTSWFAQIRSSYQRKFGDEIPAMLSECLLNFSQKISNTGRLSALKRSYSLNKEVIDYFISLHFSREKENELRSFFEYKDYFESESWLDEMITQLERKTGALSESQKETLHELEKLVLAGKEIRGNGDNKRELIAELKTFEQGRTEPGKDVNWINQAVISFTEEFFSERLITLENLENFERAFREKFEMRMNPKLSSLILKYVHSKRHVSERGHSPQEPAIPSKKNDVTRSVEFHLESKAFLSSKLEKLIVGWEDVEAIQRDYFEKFSVEIQPKILDFWKSKLADSNRKNAEKPSIIIELSQFLRKNGNDSQLAVLNQIVNDTPEMTHHNWFESILNVHKDKFGVPLPLDLQQLLLSFASQKNDPKKALSETENEPSQNRKNETSIAWLEYARKEQRKKEIDSDAEREKRLNFISRWLEKSVLTSKEILVLEMEFFKKFQDLIPQEWKEQLGQLSVHVRDSNDVEFSSTNGENVSSDFGTSMHGKTVGSFSESVITNAKNSFRNNLLSYMETLPVSEEKNTLIEMIREYRNLSPNKWFQQLLERYKSEKGTNMPMSLQTILLTFMQEHNSVSREVQEDGGIDKRDSHSAFRLLVEFESNLEQVYSDRLIESGKEIDLRAFSSILVELVSNEPTQVERSYKFWLGSDLPHSIRLKLQKSSDINHGLKSRLLIFLKEKNADQMIQMVDSSIELFQSNWLESINDQCTLKFGRSLSKREKNMLLSFAANDEFNVTKSNEQHRDRTYSQGLSEDLVRYIESNRTAFARLNEKYQFVQQSLEGDTNKSSLSTNELGELQRKFQVYFGESLSVRTVEELVQIVRKSSESKVRNQSVRSKLRPVKPKKRKMISNKAKLIRLREELKAIKEGKKVEESPIITNAGLIFGWVFWKSIFSGFSWLEDGKFVRTETVNSAVLAANWLHYSVNQDDTINPLILFIFGLTEEEFVRITEEELEAKMNGESLEQSVKGYYQMILSMWPIFDYEHLSDFIDFFVDREALMQESPVGIKLKLTKEPIDALTNNKPLPWPISIVNFSWISQIIEVEW